MRLKKELDASGNEEEASKRIKTEVQKWMGQAKEMLLQQRFARNTEANIEHDSDSEKCKCLWCSFEPLKE